MPLATRADLIACEHLESSATLQSASDKPGTCARKNQLPPHATSPVTTPNPGTSNETPLWSRYDGTFSTVTRPDPCSVVVTTPEGVSILCSPGPILPMCCSVRTRPIVPCPHMPRKPTLLK